MADRSNASSALLIGTNISGEKIRECAAISRRSKNTKTTHLDGVLKDLSQMTMFMNDRRIPVLDVILGQHQTKLSKDDLMKTIEKFFKQQHVRRFVIYYTGHGSNGTFGTKPGDWCFEKNDASPDASESSGLVYIGLDDILGVWDNMRQKLGSDSFEYEERDILYIIADSCYSGGWVDAIKSERGLKSDPKSIQYRDVHMIASCTADQPCYYTAKGGDFTDRFINADSSKHNLRDTSAHLVKLTAQSVFQTVTFPIYMPIKGISNYLNVTSHSHYPICTNDNEEEYRILLMKYDGDKLPIGKGLAIASGWSWMLSGQIFHN